MFGLIEFLVLEVCKYNICVIVLILSIVVMELVYKENLMDGNFDKVM